MYFFNYDIVCQNEQGRNLEDIKIRLQNFFSEPLNKADEQLLSLILKRVLFMQSGQVKKNKYHQHFRVHA